MKSKEDLKKEADSVALEFGYNPLSVNLDVINVKDAYCNGYMNGAKDVIIDFSEWQLLNKYKPIQWLGTMYWTKTGSIKEYKTSIDLFNIYKQENNL